MSLLIHALCVLNCFSERDPELRLSEISRRLGISTSHTHRLLTTLVEEGVLRRELHSPKYRLGLRLFELGRLAVDDLHLPLALPAMQELGRRTGETVLLSVRDKSEVVFVQQVESTNALRVSPPLHRRYSGWTAAGQVLVAWEEEAEIEYVIRHLIAPTSGDAETMADQFRAALASTQRLGFAVSEQQRGVRAVAAPVRDVRGRVVAALSVAAPIQRLTRRHIPTTAILVRQAAEQVSDQLRGAPVRIRLTSPTGSG